MKTRRNITVAQDVASALGEELNASAYIEALVRADIDGTEIWRCRCLAILSERPARRCPECGEEHPPSCRG